MPGMRPPPNNYASALGDFSGAILNSHPEVSPYTNNYLGGHALALAKTFPTVSELLGPNTFAALARVYIQYHPPLQWDLNLYGDHFPQWIKAQTQSPRAADFEWEILSTLARVEYAITRVYYADDGHHDSGEPFIIVPTHHEGLALAATLAPHHPFVDIEQDLSLTRPIKVWRNGLRVQLGNCAASSTACA